MFASVIVPRPLVGALTYEVPQELTAVVKFGSAVKVPFRRGTIEGFVVALHEAQPTNESGKAYAIKPIQDVFSADALFDDIDLRFYQWIADYYQASMGEVFFSALPKVFLKGPRKRGVTASLGEINQAAILDSENLALTTDQARALEAIEGSLTKEDFASYLLYGVTGSGKTEVYIRAAKKVLALNKTVVILVPEIALTPQLRSRFVSHFGDNVAVLHSSLAEADRRDYWWDLRKGKRRIVVGARSALFAPLSNIGLIVVDEEHEPSYKQDGHLRYNARDLAIVRARLHNATVILGSATPSVETFYGAANNKHTLLKLSSRPSARPMPVIEIADLKNEQSKDHYAPVLIGSALKARLRSTLSANEQAMIFLNRKGFSSYLICSDCGVATDCPHCSVTLTYYKHKKLLRCHYCGIETKAPTECLQCFGSEFRYIGFGTETVEEELRKLFPTTNIARLDADTAQTPKDLEEILNAFRSGEIQVLIGTQMLAKGHDFPNVTLIGVVLAESGLHIPDFRAGERTFQLLSQVAGRAGRGDKPGHVILQTFMPDNPIIQRAVHHDYDGFYADEIKVRASLGYPPYSRMAQIEFRSKSDSTAENQAHNIAQALRSALNTSSDSLELIGPAPAAISKIADEFRWQLTLRSEKISALSAYLKTARRLGARLIDVDPMNAL